MYDNGVGSEVYRRRYLVSFGTERSEAETTDQLDLPWAGRTGFLAASLKLKNDLIARPTWPTSVQGWRLVRRGAELAMVPPGKEARPVALAGALGPDRDGGDARLEARAQRIEELAQAIDRNAEISAENERNCGIDETRPCAARKPMGVVGMLDNGAESLGSARSSRPMVAGWPGSIQRAPAGRCGCLICNVRQPDRCTSPAHSDRCNMAGAMYRGSSGGSRPARSKSIAKAPPCGQRMRQAVCRCGRASWISPLAAAPQSSAARATRRSLMFAPPSA